MLTKRDRTLLLQEFKEVFVTKNEFKMELLELKAELLETFITKDEFLAKFDELIGEFKAFHEELAALAYRSREHSDQVENLTQRVIQIEKKPAAA